MSVHIIIQARMGSSRLPGKVLLPIGSKPAIRHCVDRCRRCKEAGTVSVATSTLTGDDALYNYCEENSIPCFRDSEDDVLERYYGAALWLGASEGDYIVRVTGDCPFIDPEVCDAVIALALESGADYASNTVEETFPDGLDCECFTFETLCRMRKEASMRFEREHVTQYAKRNPEKFKLRSFRAPRDLSAERWTLDEPRDYEFLCRVYEGLGKEFFSMEGVLDFLDRHPEIREINREILRNEGLIKSLKSEGEEL